MMADTAEVGPEDEVLEIGPGLGILTRALLERARRVIAVELDKHLAEHLANLAPGSHLTVVRDDALRFDPADYFLSDYKLVANLPYQIASPILSRFLFDVRRPEVLVIMVQREVAERIAAPAGRASYLSILAQSQADVRIVRRVSAGAFYPRPKVTSAVLEVRPKVKSDIPESLRLEFLELVRAGFTQPRKTLANSLAQGLQQPRSVIEARLLQAGLNAHLRPQDLAVQDWWRLLRPAPGAT